MEHFDDTLVKRSLLYGARIRFSYTGATIRNQAIQRIIEQALASSENGSLSEAQIQQLITLSGETPILRTAEVANGLEALVADNRVEKDTMQAVVIYRLKSDIVANVKQSLTNAGELWDDVVRSLFTTDPKTHYAYKSAFMFLLCRVFSVISESNVRILSKLQDGEEVADSNFLTKSIRETCEAFDLPDQPTYIYGVRAFFKDSNPKYDTLKWNMSQNFYIIKALGIDSSDLLSPTVFKDCALYCDTNVLIKGLTPVPKYKGSLIELSKACKDVGIELFVARNTLLELDSVLEYHSSLLRDYVGKIPQATLPNVHDFLLEAYLYEKAIDDGVTVDSIINCFTDPLRKLSEVCNITEVDDVWFDAAERDKETVSIAASITTNCLETRRRHKSKFAATHDAVLIRWIERENKDNNKSWIVTHDLSLVEWNKSQNQHGVNIITIDALLQWMTPIALQSNNEDTMAFIFSSALAEQLLPVENFITLQDFQVFDDMGIETQLLPSEDVEACVREIRMKCSLYDPSKAEDREKIGHILQKFFADPGRKYSVTLSELNSRINEQNEFLNIEIKSRKIAEQKAEEALNRSIYLEEQIEKKDTELVSSNGRIDKLEETIKHVLEINSYNESKIKLIIRSMVCVLLFVVIETIICLLIMRYGEGPNWFVKITNNWAWVAGGLGVSLVISRFIVGREGLLLIKHWKGE